MQQRRIFIIDYKNRSHQRNSRPKKLHLSLKHYLSERQSQWREEGMEREKERSSSADTLHKHLQPGLGLYLGLPHVWQSSSYLSHLPLLSQVSRDPAHRWSSGDLNQCSNGKPVLQYQRHQLNSLYHNVGFSFTLAETQIHRFSSKKAIQVGINHHLT